MEYIKVNDTAIGIKQIASGLYLKNICYLCRKHFKENEEIVIIVCPSGLRKQFPEFRRNQLAHQDELMQYVNSATTVEELFAMLTESKKPKKETLTKEQVARIDIFIQAAYNIGYKDATKKKDGSVSCKKYGSSDTIVYNVYTDGIDFRNRRRRQLGDGFAERAIIARAFNEFHNLLGDGKHDDYNALKEFGECLGKAVEVTNRMMGG